MARLLHRLLHRSEPPAVATARDATTAIEGHVRNSRRSAAHTQATERERQRRLDELIRAVSDRTNPGAGLDPESMNKVIFGRPRPSRQAKGHA